MLKFSQLVLRSSKSAAGFQNLARLSSFPSASTVPAQNAIENEVENKPISAEVKQTDKTNVNKFLLKSSNAMVTAAFASINADDDSNEIKTPQTDAKLASAKSVNDILSISDGVGVSRKHALKVCI